MRIIFAILVTIFTVGLFAQQDSTYIHSRKKAAILSTVLPGAGQIYNEFGHRKVQGRKHISWWRAPIFLGGLAGAGYLSYINADSAAIYKKEWFHRDEFGDSINFYPKFSGFSKADMQLGFEEKAKYRDYAIAGFALIYALNVVDAFVDAHFVTFDVSDDLSFSFRPRYFGRSEFGATITLGFK